MDVFQPKMLTRIALIYLEEAVLDVLFKARRDHGGLLPKKIAKLIVFLHHTKQRATRIQLFMVF